MKPKAYSYLRMSTDLQLKGDSKRRQLEASKAYAESKGLELADDAQLEDIGISAFKGANVREGSLGRFLDAVRAGIVERGSYLLVESLDRISREEILKAQSLFLSIIQAGIILVTLADGRTYQAESTNVGDLVMSLFILSRAHEESLIKSQRVTAAWSNKRSKAANGQPMTAWCPAWLKLSADRSVYETITDRVEVVRQIFSEAANGVGMYRITQRLNETNTPTFSTAKGWHQSYVAKILSSRSVLGEFQPHHRVDGKSVPDGEPISDYFPAVISEEIFYQAQHGKSQRRLNGAGRKGEGFTNLFSGLARCAYCDSSILFENKGDGKKNGKYLVCEAARRKLGCTGIRWRYRDFETSFLTFVKELDLESVVKEDVETEKRRKLEAEISSVKGELSSTSSLMTKTYELLALGNAVGFISDRLADLERRRQELDQRLQIKENELRSLTDKISSIYQSKAELLPLIRDLQGPATIELYNLRAQIASKLKNLIDTLIVASVGDKPRMEKTLEFLRQHPEENLDVIRDFESRLSDERNTRRYFAIGFKNNTVQAVYPDQKDPTRFDPEGFSHTWSLETDRPDGFSLTGDAE